MRIGLWFAILLVLGSHLIAQTSPVIAVFPDSFYVQSPAGTVLHDTLYIGNTGADTLHVSIMDEPPASRAASGPDAFGYEWMDSNDPDGPVFDWVDISGTGTPLSLYDDDDVQVVLPFLFPFYGTPRMTVRINSNGYLSFGWSGSELENATLPNPDFPNSLICPFWDDLAPVGWENGHDWGTVYYQSDVAGGRFIVQYDHVSHFHLNTPINPETFQVILYDDGSIVMQYLQLSLVTQCTVGLENDDGTVGLQVVRDSFYLTDGLAIWLGVPPVPDWLAAAPEVLAVPPGGQVPVPLAIDTNDIADGTYTRQLRIQSDDPAQPETLVPVTLEVATPMLSLTPGEIDFGQVPVFGDYSLDLTVQNTGSGLLQGGMHCVQPFLLQQLGGPCDSLAFALAAGESLQVAVTFAPDEAIAYAATLDVCLADGQQHVVSLAGEGYWVPQLQLTPDSYTFTMLPDTDSLTTLQVANAGTGTLQYTASVVYPATRDSLTVLQASFDNGIPSTWSIVDGGTSADTWQCVSDHNGNSIDGTPFAFVNSDGAGNNQLNEQLITPSFNVTMADGLWLEFDHFFYYYEQGGSEVADVDVWNGVAWQNVYRRTSTAGSWSNPAHVVLNILDHANAELRVRFHYYNAQWDWFWAVDNVKLWGYCGCTQNWLTINDGTTYTDSIPMQWPADELTLRFNALGMDPGVYHSEIQFSSNDPVSPAVVLPLCLTISSQDTHPHNIRIAVQQPDVQLSWDIVPGAQGYKVYAASTPEGAWDVVYAGDVPVVNDRAIWSEPIAANRRYYRVTAIYGGTRVNIAQPAR